MASGLYSNTLKKVMDNTLTTNFDSQTFNCMLVTAGYVPQLDTDTGRADVSSEVATGSGYVQWGKALTGVALSVTNDGSSIITWNADDITWASSTITGAAAAVIFDNTTANFPLIAYIDFAGSFSTTSGTFEIQWNPSGIFTLDLKP